MISLCYYYYWYHYCYFCIILYLCHYFLFIFIHIAHMVLTFLSFKYCLMYVTVFVKFRIYLKSILCGNPKRASHRWRLVRVSLIGGGLYQLSGFFLYWFPTGITCHQTPCLPTSPKPLLRKPFSLFYFWPRNSETESQKPQGPGTSPQKCIFTQHLFVLWLWPTFPR